MINYKRFLDKRKRTVQQWLTEHNICSVEQFIHRITIEDFDVDKDTLKMVQDYFDQEAKSEVGRAITLPPPNTNLPVIIESWEEDDLTVPTEIVTDLIQEPDLPKPKKNKKNQ